MRLNKLYYGYLCILIGCMISCQDSIECEVRDNLLPDGMFPIEFAAVAWQGSDTQNKTRITEDPSGIHSFWSEGDEVGLRIAGGDNDASTVGILSKAGNITHPPLFWHTAQNSTVTGWYPARDGTISLQNQRQQLTYILKTDPKTCNYLSGPIQLEFKHQLAKVRIILTGGFSWLRFSRLAIWGHTSCTATKGEFSADKEMGYIEMRGLRSRQRIFEVHVFPIEIKEGEKALRVSYWHFQKFFTLDKGVKLKAGHMYTLTLDAKVFD